MLEVHLTASQREAVLAMRHDLTLAPAERDRVEMLLLSDAGWSPLQIAAHFACCVATVRRLLHRFRSQDLSALRRLHPGPQPDATRRDQVTTALVALLAQDRTWTAGQLADALAEQDILLGARQVSRYLHLMDARYLRTVRTLQPKQDPARVAQARTELAALKKRLKPAS
jgi:putative transposase